MKLDPIEKAHIEYATKLIDEQGIPKDFIANQYYVVVNKKEYPFKYLIRTAYKYATKTELNFQSNEDTRSYIERLGYEIRYYKEGYNFFTKEELDFFSSIVNEDYRKSNIQQKYYNQKLYSIIAKVNYWAEQLQVEGFRLRKDGNWLNGHTARIKSYFWPRIYSKEDKDIFFNVEVNGAHRFIGYKLDGYYETTKALPRHKIILLEEFKKKINWQWPRVPFDKLNEYNWDKLIEETREYVKQYLPFHNQLKLLLSKETKIARITWNSNNWVKPSGKSGKSINPSYEFEHGFGHEEWLFDGDKIIDGYKYGFLEPINKFYSKYEGKIFDISLYTRNGKENQNYWVTTLENVEVVHPNEAKEILTIYKDNGWYKQMKEDLLDLNLDSEQLDIWLEGGAEQLFNIKFEADQISNISTELILVEEDKDIPSNRYNLMDISYETQQKYERKAKTGFSFEDSGSENSDLAESSTRKGQNRDIELELKHNILQKKFLKYMQNKYGKTNIRRECKAFGASRIDVVQSSDVGFVFYEIKTYNNLRVSIREGIGQLLEYCLFPNVNESYKLVLVSHIEPTEEVRGYIQHLKKYINLPFFYIYFDIDKDEIVEEI